MSEYWRDFATNTAGRWFTVIFGDLSGSQVLIHLMHTLFILYCSWSLIKMPRGLQSNVSLAHCLVHHYHFYQLNQRETSHSIFHELMQIGINYIFLSLIAHGLPQTRTNRYHPAHHWQHPSDSSLATECVYFENGDPVKPKAGAGHELRWQNMWTRETIMILLSFASARGLEGQLSCSCLRY